MTNAQILKNRIKKRCGEQGKSVTKMLSELSLGVNAVNQINEKRGISSFALVKIANYLDCSVDYLLGITDNPEINKNNSSISVDNTQTNINSPNVQTTNITNLHSQPRNLSDVEQDVCDVLSNLTPRDRTELLSYIYSFADEHAKK